jgi:dihydrofolate reductase
MVSLDGFIAADESYEGPNWASSSEALVQHFVDIEARSDTHLYGRRVYTETAAWWPIADQSPDATESMRQYSNIWKEKRKFVFSATIDRADWNTTIIKENAAPVVQDGKDIFLYGGVLASSLIRFSLVDEFRLYFNPVLLGEGTRMLPSLHDLVRLQLLETKEFDCGVVLLHYALQSK